MPKNILVFSDGTGQAGGLRPDQELSNVYKLYRAMRVGPDSAIDPAAQIAYYDEGLGTERGEGSPLLKPWRLYRNALAAATGTGISRNIADCYAAILEHYEPGDRVWLFGFSRGAYTARCVGGVLALCGVPTHDAGGGPVPRTGAAARRIADEAVGGVYEHGSGKDDPRFRDERLEKARRFRARYGSDDAAGAANVLPHFIGVFDTVAALGSAGALWWLVAAALIAVIGVAAVGVAALLAWLSPIGFHTALALSAAVGIAWVVAGSLRANLKVIRDYPARGDLRWHLVAWRLRFYDFGLDPRVRYGRHALAIDEDRASFERVPWARAPLEALRAPGQPEWLVQMWFAGNHADIGGSYAENQSRLSDIALDWMVREAESVAGGVRVDHARLHRFPDAGGLAHSEVETLRDAWPRWWPVRWRLTWPRKLREVPADAPLHASVLERLGRRSVLQHGLAGTYRPENLRHHREAARFFTMAVAPPAGIEPASDA